jgi:hypothetical protein
MLIVARQNTNPAGWAMKADASRPRTTLENAVVMPQVGHGRPLVCMKLHGGNAAPNRWCVPNPRGSGSSYIATERMAAQASAAPAQATRAALDALTRGARSSRAGGGLSS